MAGDAQCLRSLQTQGLPSGKPFRSTALRGTLAKQSLQLPREYFDAHDRCQ